MARYNAIRIGSIYLTSNSLVGGKPCKIEVDGLPSFATDRTGQVQVSADGTPCVQWIDNDHRGLVVFIKTEFMAKSVFDSIISAHNSAKNTDTPISVDITGDTGNFTGLNCIPRVPDDIVFGKFSGGIIIGAGFRYITT